MQFNNDDDVDVAKDVSKVHGRYDIKKLVSQISDDYQVEKIDWGLPVGVEVW